MMQNAFCELPQRGVIAITGDDRKVFLENLITNDITPRGVSFACLLSPQGKYLFDFFVYDQPEALWLEVEATRLAALLQRLSMYKLRARISIIHATELIVAVSDAPITQQPKTGVVQPDPRLAALGSRMVLPRDWWPDYKAGLLAESLQECADSNYAAHCLNQGVPDYTGNLIVDRSFPLEGNLDALNGVSFTKGCYVGQELMARMHHRGLVRKRLVPVNSTTALPDPGTLVMSGEHEAGELRSASGTQGFALLRLEYLDKPLSTNDQPLTPQIPMWLERFVNHPPGN